MYIYFRVCIYSNSLCILNKHRAVMEENSFWRSINWFCFWFLCALKRLHPLPYRKSKWIAPSFVPISFVRFAKSIHLFYYCHVCVVRSYDCDLTRYYCIIVSRFCFTKTIAVSALIGKRLFAMISVTIVANVKLFEAINDLLGLVIVCLSILLVQL